MSWTPSSSSERTIACEPVITVGGTTLFGPRTGEAAACSTPASAGRSMRSGALWAPADFVAISEGLIGDPLLIGLFLWWIFCDRGTAGNKKTPQPWRLFEGFARDGSLPVEAMEARAW